jgi:UDP-N-acetylmuramate dehydrogenase
MTPITVPAEFEPRIKRNELMSRHTSWHVGGPADLWFAPRDLADLAAFLAALPAAQPVTWLGLGSNALVRDAGIRGVVICPHGSLNRLERVDETHIRAEAGVACARLGRQAVKWGLGPAEFFAGIPGTLGGALAMNAGAWGQETWARVEQVETVDRAGVIRHRSPDEFTIGYRSVVPPASGEWFVAATLAFEPDAMASTDSIRRLLERRLASQPIGEWSCGSVFTNPPGDHAARLIEAAGLKGYSVGDAMVSTKHANFIINRGHARAADIEAVIHHVQETVERVHGLRLQTEVRILGEME